MLTLRSPVPWVGGKHSMAAVILQTFPPSTAYDVYCEPFMGGCHVIARKPPFHHYEVINDINGDLVNFWLQLRDHAEDLAERLWTLPYSRKLHYDYYRGLLDGTDLDEMERAVRWFYVLQSSFSAWIGPSSSVGWKSGPRTPVSSGATMRGQPHVLQSTLALFTAMQKRFRTVEIDNRDFAAVMERYQGPRTLFYVDPPYLGVEDYYRQVDGARFGLADHERLAVLLNATASLVVLSSYEHPKLSEWYPETKWRQVRWQTVKHSQRTKATRERVTEVLLCNYPASKQMACVQAALFEQEALCDSGYCFV